jgi:hypothetical protein
MNDTLHVLIRDLEARSPLITGMNLATALQDAPISGKLLNLANQAADLDRSARAVETLVNKAGFPISGAETAVRNLLTERHFYGSFCELGAYDWLDRHDMRFAAQVTLTGQEVLNPNGCTIDGHFAARDGYFDIKGMGFQAYVADQFRAALAKRLGGGLDVTIDGSMDVSVKDIEAFAFSRLSALCGALAGGGIENIRELGWTIRAAPPQAVTMSVQTEDSYRLAEENRYFPFKTASQFTRNAPFLLVFAYAAQFNHSLFLNFAGSTEITLRSISRRAFLQLTSDTTPAGQFDDQIASGVTVGDAARLLSGLLFINLDNDEGRLFLNPRATHRILRSHVPQLFDFFPMPNLGIDDFAHDDY